MCIKTLGRMKKKPALCTSHSLLPRPLLSSVSLSVSRSLSRARFRSCTGIKTSRSIMRRSPFSANGCTHASGASTGRGGGGGGAKEKRLWSNNSLVGKKYNIYTTGLRYVVRGKRTTDEKQHETKPVSERVYYKNDERVRVGKKRKRIRCARDRVGTSENNEVCNAAAARIPRARNTNKRILYIITSLSSSYRRRSSIYI